MQNSNGNHKSNNKDDDDSAFHFNDYEQTDFSEILVFVAILVERLGGEVSISPLKILEMENAMNYLGKYLTWYVDDTSGYTVFKVMQKQEQ